jgi:hypothetical protein
MNFPNRLTLLVCLLGPSILTAQVVSAGTVDLGPVVSADPRQSNAAILDSLNGIPDAVEPATHEGTGEAIDQAQQAAAANGNLSNTKAKGPSGASGSGKRAQATAWKSDQAKKAGFLDKLGKILDVIDVVSTAAKAAGHLVEGDTIGAGEVVVNDLTKKGAAALGSAFGTAVGGPMGAVVGAGAAEEIHNATTGKLISKTADAIRDQQAQDAMLGYAQAGRYTGQVQWTFTPPAQEGAMQPPMAIQYSGPVTADLDKEGNLKMHYDLKGGMPGLGVSGATAGIGMSLQMNAVADLAGTAKEGKFTANGISKGTTKFNVDYGGAQGAPENQSQTNNASGPIKATGTYTRETMTGTFSSPGGGPPISFVLTKTR